MSTETQDIIRNMLNNIASDEPARAQEDFEAAISIKLTDVLDQRKQELAHQLGARNAEVQADS